MIELSEFPLHLVVFLYAMVFVWGTCIGSFLNVCIYRIPLDLSVVRPGSRCMSCETPIPWYDNIPILGYLVLRGRCRHCKASFSPRYAIVELLVGVLFLLTLLKFGGGARPLGLDPIVSAWTIPVYWLMIGGLVLGTFVDFDHMIIPDRVTIGGMLLGPPLSFLVPEIQGEVVPLAALKSSAIGLVFGYGLLKLVAVIGTMAFKKDAMGMGDVKLLGAVGAFCGWQAALFTMMISSLVGSVVGVSLILGRRKGLQSRIPYGPYLALAAVIWIFWGHGIVDWYNSLLAIPDYGTSSPEL